MSEMYCNYSEKLHIVLHCLNPVLSIWQSLKHVMEDMHETYVWKPLSYIVSQVIVVYESNICPVISSLTRF